MFMNSRTSKGAKQYVERKLILRLRIFFIVFGLLLAVIAYEVSRNYLEVSAVIGAMMLGVLLGSLFIRRKKIYWEEETAKVIARMDRAGVILLVIYIAFALTRHWLLHHWLHGNELTAFSLSLAAGAMAGRILGMRAQIRQILKEKGII